MKLAPLSRIFDNKSFGYRTITVERPVVDENGKVLLGQKGKLKGKPQPDSALRDTENVPLAEDVEAYFAREVLPHAADAWIDHDKTKIGYEIPFNRHFYVFEPPRIHQMDQATASCIGIEASYQFRLLCCYAPVAFSALTASAKMAPKRNQRRSCNIYGVSS